MVNTAPHTNFMCPANGGTNATGSAASASCTKVKYPATTSDPTIATISVHALMRHQNHLRMNSPPVPAPMSKSRLKAWPASVSISPRPHPSTMLTSVARRPARTCSRSLASGFKNRT